MWTFNLKHTKIWFLLPDKVKKKKKNYLYYPYQSHNFIHVIFIVLFVSQINIKEFLTYKDKKKTHLIISNLTWIFFHFYLR